MPITGIPPESATPHPDGENAPHRHACHRNASHARHRPQHRERAPARVASRRTRGRRSALTAGAIGVLAAAVTAVLSTAHPGISIAGHEPSVSDRAFPPRRGEPVGAPIARARDRLAARPMPDTGTGHPYESSPLSTRDPGAIALPPTLHVDALDVGTGYPQTPAGAIAQLAAIDTAALQSASLAGARAVISAWAAPGGPNTQTWSGIRAITGLLRSAGVPGAGSADLTVTVTPAMALLKGMVGDDFAVVCVDFSIDITLTSTTRTTAADCQRMLWTTTRWVIGPGPEPAAAPSAWPDTDAAIEAGYKDLNPQPSPSP
jgi:hypothetical protein